MRKDSFFGAFLIAVAFIGLILFGSLQLDLGQASTSVSGAISQDTTWTALGNPYVLTSDAVVNQGVTLRIEPGVIVNFGGFSFEVNGTFVARGTSDHAPTAR